MVTTPLIPDWLARLYPFKPKAFITPRGARLSYVDHGPRRDDAVLLLHGNPTWSFYYRDLVRDLAAAGLRCIAPDHVGMGLSEKPPDYDYTLATRIADLEALVGALGLKRVHLVVHDWGGAIGFGFAARHPELIGRVVILNAAAFPANHIPLRIALCGLPLLGPLIVRGCNGFAGPATSMAMRRRIMMPDEKRGYLFPYDSWANRVAVNAFVRDIPLNPSHRSWATLAAVETGLAQFRDRPALIVWGGLDFCFDDEFLTRWQRAFAAVQCIRVSDAGHYVLEDVAPQVIPLVCAHLLAH